MGALDQQANEIVVGESGYTLSPCSCGGSAKIKCCSFEEHKYRLYSCFCEKCFKFTGEFCDLAAAVRMWNESKEGDLTYDFNKKYKNMSKDQKDTIRSLHRIAQECVDYLDALAKKKEEFSKYPEAVRCINSMISNSNKDLENLEFAMQRAWGIPESVNHHTWWLYPTQCLCPKMDNRDPAYYGSGKIIVENCPIHGILVEN